MQLVLSLFPGIDLLGRGFEVEGFCVVRGPDKIFGQSVTDFTPKPHAFNGIIGGTPCQDFSRKRRHPPTGLGLAMLREFARIVHQAQPDWFLLENVPDVPDIQIAGYQVQRFNLNANECGVGQSRLRCFQFGNRAGYQIVIPRSQTVPAESQPTVMCADQREWQEVCRLQGLPDGFDLPWPKGFKKRAVGNGVPIPMAQTVARAIREATWPAKRSSVTLCQCQCGRILTGRQKAATAACRKRLEKARKEPRPIVTWPGA
jgi:DNA (cytosine-5)-methyltransferase 1